MSYSNLKAYYNSLFALTSQQPHKYSIVDIESRVPWERDILLSMVDDSLAAANKG